MQRTYAFFLIWLLPMLVLVGLLGQTAVSSAAPNTFTSSPDWGSEIPLTTSANTPFGAGRPVIAASTSGPTVTVLFNRHMGNSATANDPWFVRSFDRGSSWSAPASVYSSTDNSAQVAATYDDSRQMTHAVWREGNGLAYAPDTAWGSGAVTVLSAPQNAPGVSTPAIANGRSGLLAVVWSEGDRANPDIRITRSSDGGTSWQASQLVKGTPSSSLFPDVAIDDNDVVHVVWEEHDQAGEPGQPVPGTIYYSQSTATGWSTPVDVSSLAGASDARRPTLLLTSKGVEVAFAVETLVNTAVATQIYHLVCASQCQVPLSWVASPNVSGTSSFSSNQEIIPTLTNYKGCSLVYFHGLHSEVTPPLETIWGGSSCNNWQPLDTPTIAQALAPQLGTQGGAWVYLAYETVGANNQITFRRNIFRQYLPLISCADQPNSPCQR